MADYYVPAGQLRVFGAGTFAGDAVLDNLHNVAGPVTYQIGAAPAATIPMAVNEDTVTLPVNGQQLTITNGLPSELKVSG